MARALQPTKARQEKADGEQGGESDYTVLVEDVPIPHEAASWRLELGPFRRKGHDETGLPIWMLKVRLTRQTPEKPPWA